MNRLPRIPRTPNTLLTLSIAALLAACGGGRGGQSGAGQPAIVSQFAAAAPTSSAVDLDVAGSTAMSTDSPTLLAAAAGNTMAPGACHPHLFSRSAEVVQRLNAVFHRHLRHVDALIARDPSLVAGSTVTWSQTGSGFEVQRKLTISRSADGLTYRFELDLAPAGQTPPTWVEVMDGTQTRSTSSTGGAESVGMTLDYDALRGVLPTERLSGTIEIAFDRLIDSTRPAPGVKRTTTVTFVAFSFGPDDPHGPRSGAFTHVGEPGVGGSLSFQDALVLLCPANPGALPADTVTDSRWYVAADGSVHGRADAKATGGPIATGDTWMGVTCYQGPAGHAPDPGDEADSFWAMKLEDATGATVQSSERSSGLGACDAAFGPVPSMVDSSTDYGFPAGPITFPNEW
jgi:hypothetical protein